MRLRFDPFEVEVKGKRTLPAGATYVARSG